MEHTAGPLVFAAVTGLSLYAASYATVEKVNNALVVIVAATFAGIVGLGAQTADLAPLLDLSTQHPTAVAGCLPILFLSLVFQNVVPTVVTQLEGDRRKIVQAVTWGTAAPLILFLAWNAVILGNVGAMMVEGSGAAAAIDPVALLQNGSNGDGLLGPLVTAFSSVALITSVIGFTYGLLDAWSDVFGIPTSSAQFQQYKAPLFLLVFAPAVALSLGNPDIFYQALEYGGAFGVSTLFLLLPPLMVWNQRYRQVDQPVVTQPLVPLGKLPLVGMGAVGLALVLQQGGEKLLGLL